MKKVQEIRRVPLVVEGILGNGTAPKKQECGCLISPDSEHCIWNGYWYEKRNRPKFVNLWVRTKSVEEFNGVKKRRGSVMWDDKREELRKKSYKDEVAVANDRDLNLIWDDKILRSVEARLKRLPLEEAERLRSILLVGEGSNMTKQDGRRIWN